jgi:2-polyprenyl-3-methyl-5-hydroxy-6-metoxy-1,4-benzoquinol methylase
LFLQAYKDIPFQPWLRGALDGIDPEDCNRLMSLRDRFRPGVLTHVYLQAKAQAKYAATDRNIKKELLNAGFQATLIKANAQRLQKLVHKLSWKRSTSEWSEYTEHNSYADDDKRRKEEFVRQVVLSHPWRLVWDLGCKTGAFSRIAAENARVVVATDADQLVIERFYQSLKAQEQSTILPLVNNVADPSPNLGWRGLERKTLTERGKPDLTLCLALIHHIVITANVPLKEFIDWLASVTQELVIEFVTRDDPMVRTLLRNKRDLYTDYNTAYFEQCLSEAFAIMRQETLAAGVRKLYYARVRTR